MYKRQPWNYNDVAANFGSLVEIQNLIEALSGHIRQCKKRGIGKLAGLIVKADGAALYHVGTRLFSNGQVFLVGTFFYKVICIKKVKVITMGFFDSLISTGSCKPGLFVDKIGSWIDKLDAKIFGKENYQPLAGQGFVAALKTAVAVSYTHLTVFSLSVLSGWR